MASELYVRVPVRYGDFAWAGLDSPLSGLLPYGRDAGCLLNLHLQMVFYSKVHRTDGFVLHAVVRRLCRPASARIAKRDALRLAEAGFITPVDDGYDVPAARDWPCTRVGSRDAIPEFIRKRVYERDGYRCTECGSEDGLTLDHIIPWSLNGPDDVSNLRVLCGSCNSRKGARTLWPASGRSSLSSSRPRP